jgi:rubrerythrin
MPGGSSLNDKELLIAFFKQAVVREQHSRSKFLALAENMSDRRLKKMFNDFVNTTETHLSMLKAEMNNLNVK